MCTDRDDIALVHNDYDYLQWVHIGYKKCKIDHQTSYKQIAYFRYLMNIDCPNRAFNTFLELYLNACNESFPLKDIHVRTKYIKSEPWFTSGLLKSSKTKSKLLSIKIRDPTDENIQKYKTYNNTFNKLSGK